MNYDNINEKFRTFDHEYTLEWFDKEFNKYLNIDIYDISFPKDKGYHIWKNDDFDLLIIRLEDLTDVFEKAIKEFVGLDLPLLKNNVGSEKEYASLYREFKKNYTPTPKLIDEMYKSKYTQHFYASKEVTAFREKWI